jgi:serine/threonine protein kinase
MIIINVVQGVVGQGSYGIVKLAYNQEDDKNYAMKILRWDTQSTKILPLNRLYISGMVFGLTNPNSKKLYCAYVIDNNKCF